MLLQKKLIGPWLIFSMVAVIESATDEILIPKIWNNLPGEFRISPHSWHRFKSKRADNAKHHMFEKINLQRYYPLVTDDLLNNDKRFQQIMQGSSSSSDALWPDKHKLEKIDVEKEINKLNITYVHQPSWPELYIELGSVTAVSFDKAGNVVIFHRCDRIWDSETFTNTNVFTKQRKGPIRESTVLALESVTGKLVYDWGKNLFYMPHGLTIDHDDNVWITDVALHQVFKFGPRGSNDKPLMILGTAFTPGVGEKKFCKPTSVAVLENGDFFVADGYCNARILKYTKTGEKILQWGQNTFLGVSIGVAPQNFLAIPHALTLVPEKELVCAADRENGRIQCFSWLNGTFHSQYHSQIIGDRLFSMDYTPAHGGQFVIVNGPTAELGVNTNQHNEVRGYVMDFSTKKVTGKFGPNDMEFANPHDIAVTRDGIEVYVADLNPMRIYKFLHKSVAKSVPLTVNKRPYSVSADAQNGVENSHDNSDGLLIGKDMPQVTKETHHRPGATSILVASLMLLFAFLTFGLALLIARSRKRGNAASLTIGQPSGLVYRKLVASNQNICDGCP